MTLTRRNFLEANAAAVLVRPGLLPGAASQGDQQTANKESARPRAWAPQQHPRLHFSREDLEQLRAKRTADEVAAAAWARVKEAAETALDVELPPMSDRWEWDTGADKQVGLGAVVSRSTGAVSGLTGPVSSLALSWLLEGDEKHARKATDLLMGMCAYDFWTSLRFFGTDYQVPWRGQIQTALFCQTAAYGYDWLYDFMSEKERQRLRTSLLYKGILPVVQDYADPLTRLPVASHMKPYYNFWQASVAPAGEATMALYGEHPLADRFVRLCKEASDWWFRFEGWTVPVLPERQQDLKPGNYYPPNFDSEGGYWEGLNYMDGVLIRSFCFGEAYRRQMGEDFLPMDLMRKLAVLILNQSFRMGDRMRGVNFADTRAGFATSPLVTAYLARRLRHSGLQWFLHNCQNNFNEPSHFRANELPALTFLWYDPSVRPEEPHGAVPVKVYPGMGVAVMRSGWGHEDSMLAFKCGVTAGHAHPDAGSFVLYSRDELLAIDSGVCGYEMPQYKNYYHTTRAHSSVLVGGEGQIKHLAGKIVEQAGVPELGFVVGDATAPYEGRLTQFLRGVLFAGNQYYVLADWLNKDSDAPFQWLLHYDGEMSKEPEGYMIRKGKAAMLVKMVEPAEHHLTIGQGYKTYHEALVVKSTAEKEKELQRGDYLEITPARNLRRQLFLTVLYPFAAGSARPQIKNVASSSWTGVRIDRDLIGLRQTETSTRAALEDVETDARLFCVTPNRALMYSGTYLKRQGKTLLSAPKPATLAVEV